MKIEISDGRAMIYAPYNRDFVSKIKAQIGGAKWTGTAWSVPEASVDSVRQLMMEVYGETDIPDGTRKVTVLVTVTDSLREERGAVILFGKSVARAYGRDSGGKPGDEVSFIEKAPRSGGSRNRWETVVPTGAVFKVRNVPEGKVTEGTFRYDGYGGEYKVQIITEDEFVDREALREERNRLLVRLARINELLGETDRTHEKEKE